MSSTGFRYQLTAWAGAGGAGETVPHCYGDRAEAPRNRQEQVAWLNMVGACCGKMRHSLGKTSWMAKLLLRRFRWHQKSNHFRSSRFSSKQGVLAMIHPKPIIPPATHRAIEQSWTHCLAMCQCGLLFLAAYRNVWVTRFGDKMYEDLEDARQASGIKDPGQKGCATCH